MRKEEDYMDQLFKDHFEDFAKSPGEGVWEGVVANGAMANGKKLGYPPYWKLGLLLVLGLFLTFGILQGRQMLMGEETTTSVALAEEIVHNGIVNEANPAIEAASTQNPGKPSISGTGLSEAGNNENEKEPEGAANAVAAKGKTEVPAVQREESTGMVYQSVVSEQESTSNSVVANRFTLREYSESGGEPTASVDSVETSNAFDDFLKLDLLNLDHLPKDPNGATWASFNDPLSVKSRRDMARSWMMKAQGVQKIRGGHWFISGSFIADASIESDKKFILGLDGMAFGAGKYLTPDSFIEISLRGAWSNGFNMRANYARLFLPGRLRPYVQGGIAWGENVGVRMGLGLMYTPETFDKWRFYVAANYEAGLNSGEGGTREAGIFEVGAQIRLSGTERVLSDNNWMNSVPLYELPTGWYADVSVNFSFDNKTKVVDYSAYMGKYLKRRLFIRGGLRVDRDDVAIPVQVQYHFLVRKQLRFGAYTGASLEVQNTRLGAELGFIAYYEVIPGWSLFVAPVLLEGSTYNERLFETGIQLNLAKKK